MTPRRDERGSITLFAAILAIALVMVAGMAYDGGSVIRAHGAARHDAAQAARAGAQEIDLTYLRLTNRARLDPGAAERAAVSYLHRVGADGSASVDGTDITVTVTRVQPLRILPGVDRTITVSATASAIEGP